MQKHTDGDAPAFPTLVVGQPHTGMSLRDYFAAQALAGVVNIDMFRESDIINAATLAYRLADAMLRARAVQSPADTMRAHLDEFGK